MMEKNGPIRMEGLIVPVITPFTREGEIDVPLLKNHLDFLINSGITFFFILGTTGEFFLLTMDERKRISEIIIDHIGDKGKVYINIGALSTAASCELAEHAQNAGAKGIGAITPYFFSATQNELERYYLDIAGSVNPEFPVYLYNLPENTGNDLLPETVKKLSKKENIIGIKNSMNDIGRIKELISSTTPDFDVLIGSDEIIYPAMLSGAKGAVSGTANVFPEIFVEFFKAFSGGLNEEARQQQMIINNLAGLMNKGFPSFKEALFIRGHQKCYTRKPVDQLTLSEKKLLKKGINYFMENP
jgi:dihydrodipicolinate synthase/N-acetylneuraminate lyase